jgi:glucose/arabinose dehydrogenase
MAIYRSALFPEWQGKLLIGALVDKDVKLLTLTDGSVSQIKSLFAELNERIRDVRVDSEGALYLLTDSAKGRVLRITPAT